MDTLVSVSAVGTDGTLAQVAGSIVKALPGFDYSKSAK